MKNTIAGVDLAKDVIQVCICKNNTMHSNTEAELHAYLHAVTASVRARMERALERVAREEGLI